MNKNIPRWLRLLDTLTLLQMPRKPIKHPLYNKILAYARRHSMPYETLNNRQILLTINGRVVWFTPYDKRCRVVVNHFPVTTDLFVDGSLSVLFDKLYQKQLIYKPLILW